MDMNEKKEKEQKASEEQKRLAEFIKSTHVNLRKESAIYGATTAWQRHVAKNDILKSYALSMKKLATLHWAEATGIRKDVRCRIDWIKAQCENYFNNGGKEHFNVKEAIIQSKLNPLPNSFPPIKVEKLNIGNTFKDNDGNCHCFGNDIAKVKLLDVGSCYNPFRDHDMFKVTAIDLAPSTDSVLQCDFLNVKVGDKIELSDDGTSLIQLAASYFDAVVFSLLLEYLPCPKQRFLCCKKAYDLLSSGGILVIITPDSKHANANAKFMKSWRLILSKLGFMRVCYEKLPHMHCLVYRKCIHAEVAWRWANLQAISEDDDLFTSNSKIFIPQDFQQYSQSDNMEEEKVKYDSDDLVTLFSELPYED